MSPVGGGEERRICAMYIVEDAKRHMSLVGRVEERRILAMYTEGDVH